VTKPEGKRSTEYEIAIHDNAESCNKKVKKSLIKPEKVHGKGEKTLRFQKRYQNKFENLLFVELCLSG